jgi:hypothetical protein
LTNTLNNSVIYLSDSFNPSLSNTYELQMVLGWEHLYYGLVNYQNKVVLLNKIGLNHTLSYSKAISEAVLSNENLTLKFRNVKLASITPYFTLMPIHLVTKDNSQYINALKSKNNESISIANDVNSEIKLFFEADNALVNITNQLFPDHKLFHINSALIKSMQTLAEQRTGKQVYAHIRENYLFIFTFENDELLFSNSYPFKNAQDFIYYFLLNFQQHQLDQENTPVFLSGNVLPDSELYKIIFLYIRHVSFSTTPSFVDLETTDISLGHMFYDVLSLKLCE